MPRPGSDREAQANPRDPRVAAEVKIRDPRVAAEIRRYRRRNLRLTALLLSIWAVTGLGFVVLRARRGRYDVDRTGLAMCQLYRLFVVLVWPILYALVYLQ